MRIPADSEFTDELEKYVTNRYLTERTAEVDLTIANLTAFAGYLNNPSNSGCIHRLHKQSCTVTLHIERQTCYIKENRTCWLVITVQHRNMALHSSKHVVSSHALEKAYL